MRSVTLTVQGMRCNRCADTIRALIEREPGVKIAAVSFESDEARILYDPMATDEGRLVTVVERPGYRVIGRIP